MTDFTLFFELLFFAFLSCVIILCLCVGREGKTDRRALAKEMVLKEEAILYGSQIIPVFLKKELAFQSIEADEEHLEEAGQFF